MPDTKDAAPATKRVRMTVPAEIGGVRHPVGAEMDFPAADADALVKAGRAKLPPPPPVAVQEKPVPPVVATPEAVQPPQPVKEA